MHFIAKVVPTFATVKWGFYGGGLVYWEFNLPTTLLYTFQEMQDIHEMAQACHSQAPRETFPVQLYSCTVVRISRSSQVSEPKVQYKHYSYKTAFYKQV